MIALTSLALSPAFAGPGKYKSKRPRPTMRAAGTIFTPAAGDPRLAAVFARGSTRSSTFRVTPARGKNQNRAVTVAVRTRTGAPPRSPDRSPARRTAAVSSVEYTPASYNLGVSVGWRRFALSGEVVQADLGTIQGGRRTADVGVSYSRNRLTTSVQLQSERPLTRRPLVVNQEESVSVDFGGSYRLTRRIDLTAGVRYKAERDIAEPSVTDNRRDSQAVYVGTAIRF